MFSLSLFLDLSVPGSSKEFSKELGVFPVYRVKSKRVLVDI